MRVDWDVPIAMDDGVVVRADVFRPTVAGRYPALMTYGPYGKGLAFQEGYKTAWEIMARDYPDAVEGTSNTYQAWEVPDPEKWVPDGYVCIRVDSRGAGRSEGFLDVHGPRETKDLYDCIEWAAAQPWCDGNVALLGISYYAANQWRVAALQPPHLKALCIWEGFADNYRDATHHGGIICTFRRNWQEMQVKTVQHGLGTRGPTSRVTGELVCGPETLGDEELAKNRSNMWGEYVAHALDGDYWWAQAGDMDKIVTPMLSAGNWGGNGLHLRGNVEGFVNAASRQKWLEMHGGAHWAEFYTDYGLDLQKRFLGHFLKGQNTGWDKQPRVQIQIRRPGQKKFPVRHENEWPLARTQWTKFYLDPGAKALSTEPPKAASALEYEAMGDGVTFLTPPLAAETEITGPSAAKLFLSSKTVDADVFLVLQVFDPKGEEVVFYGALDPHTPVGQGWLRASHRKLDPKKSLPYRPYHTHDEIQPLRPNVPVELDVEIWPTCIVVPAGYRIGLSLRGKDYEWAGAATTLSNMKNPMKGCGPFVHDDPADRPTAIFGGTYTLHFETGKSPYLLLPVIPPR
jgi:predicted acyl esterase